MRSRRLSHMVAGTSDVDVGHVLAGKYRLEEVVDAGSTGVVYRATHISLGKTVIVKLLGSTYAGDPLRTTRFHREAKVASLVQHPNVVQILDFGEEEDGSLFLVMENLVGTTLDVLIETGNVSFSRAMEIMRQVLSGVRAAHRHNIIHRDIKPANVLVVETVNEDGEPQDLVKVLDFGIAKSMDPGSGGPSATMDLVSGTPQFMSPEQCQGHKLDTRSDLYSCGCVLYFLLTGKAPFTADNPVAVIYKHVSEEPTPPSECSDSPPEMDAIVARAMAKRPESRFQNAQEMRTALSQAAGHFLPSQHPSGSSPARASWQAKRSLTPPLAAAAAPSSPPPPSMPPTPSTSIKPRASASIPVSTSDVPPARASNPASTPPHPSGEPEPLTAGPQADPLADTSRGRGKPVDGVVRGMVGGPALDTPLGWVPEPHEGASSTASSAFDAPVVMNRRTPSKKQRRWLFVAAVVIVFMLTGACLGLLFGNPGEQVAIETDPDSAGGPSDALRNAQPPTDTAGPSENPEDAPPSTERTSTDGDPVAPVPDDSVVTALETGEPATTMDTRGPRPRYGPRGRGRRPYNPGRDRDQDWQSDPPGPLESDPVTVADPVDPITPADPGDPPPADPPETTEVLPPPPPEVPRQPDPPRQPPAAPSLTARTQLSGLGVVGPMAVPTIQRSLAGASGAFGSCYRNAAQRAGRDGYGRVNLAFRIDETGGARRVQVNGARLPGLNRCMAQVVNRLSFRPRPVGVVNVTFNVSYLSPG